MTLDSRPQQPPREQIEVVRGNYRYHVGEIVGHTTAMINVRLQTTARKNICVCIRSESVERRVTDLSPQQEADHQIIDLVDQALYATVEELFGHLQSLDYTNHDISHFLQDRLLKLKTRVLPTLLVPEKGSKGKK